MTGVPEFGVNLNSFPGFREPPAATVAFVRLAEQLGYHEIRVLDHVVGIAAERHGGIARTPYTSRSQIRECFTLLAYLSAVTERIRLLTGVLALPQRQTVLVAKQAAEVDILSGGRLTLGVGVGYNPVEFEAMGAPFGDRGAHFEEQIAVLRRLWTEEEVSFEGRWHRISDASLAPLPVQRPIPVWIGLGRMIAPIPPEPVLRRVGRLADGWLPLFGPDEAGRGAVETVRRAALDAGRDPDAIVMEMVLDVAGKGPDRLADDVARLRDFGAGRINLLLPGNSAADQTEAMKRFREVMDRF
ncbi:MAG: TIGR03619 family F420-dependent LLM class oxidoreductase [Alphaproteobacteria bacterium]|nr:TIGR03619 family F420-dependent LLM class oxidoreductase [Alphaproteobacteria bacterium]